MLLGVVTLGSRSAQFGTTGLASRRLPENIIVATQSVTNIRRKQTVSEVSRTLTTAEAKRTVTFDG